MPDYISFIVLGFCFAFLQYLPSISKWKLSSHLFILFIYLFIYFPPISLKFCCCLVTKSCLTRDSMDSRPPNSSGHGIFQVRILEWVASSGDLLNPGLELESPPLQTGSCHLGSPSCVFNFPQYTINIHKWTHLKRAKAHFQ